MYLVILMLPNAQALFTNQLKINLNCYINILSTNLHSEFLSKYIKSSLSL